MSDAKTGQSVPRLEDQRFLTGSAVYADDLNVEGQLYGVVVRSTHAHAEIKGIDVSAALASVTDQTVHPWHFTMMSCAIFPSSPIPSWRSSVPEVLVTASSLQKAKQAKPIKALPSLRGASSCVSLRRSLQL